MKRRRRGKRKTGEEDNLNKAQGMEYTDVPSILAAPES